MRALITGATGFLGSQLTARLLASGHDVVALGRKNGSLNHRGLVWHQISTYSELNWDEYVKDVSVVYHLAWSSLPSSSNRDRVGDASTNVVGTLRLLDALIPHPNVRLVFPSSGGTIYGNNAEAPNNENQATHPNCAYGISKLAIEHYLRLYREQFDLDAVALRISNPYGPGQLPATNFGVIPTFALNALTDQPIKIFGDGSVVRDYVFIDDVVGALCAAGETRAGPTVINVGSGVGRSLNEIVQAIELHLSKKIDVQYIANRKFDVAVSILDVALAKSALGWKAETSFEDGLGATLTFLKHHLGRKRATG